MEIYIVILADNYIELLVGIDSEKYVKKYINICLEQFTVIYIEKQGVNF